MCDPRQGSTLTGQPRNAICRVTWRLRTSAGGSATFLNHLRTLTLKHTHNAHHTQAYTHARTRQDGTGRTQGLASSHLSAAERSVHQVEQSGARTARSWNKHTPLPQLPSPHFGARFDPSLVSHHRSSPRARRSLARSLHMARWPRRPSLMLQPAGLLCPALPLSKAVPCGQHTS